MVHVRARFSGLQVTLYAAQHVRRAGEQIMNRYKRYLTVATQMQLIQQLSITISKQLDRMFISIVRRWLVSLLVALCKESSFVIGVIVLRF